MDEGNFGGTPGYGLSAKVFKEQVPEKLWEGWQ